MTELRTALIQRSRNSEADIRDRIDCGRVLGDLGDPRFEQVEGTDHPFIRPPMVVLAAGTYPIGSDTAFEWTCISEHGITRSHCPQHEIQIPETYVGQFPVTNVEWKLFMLAQGYEDEGWWDSPDALNVA